MPSECCNVTNRAFDEKDARDDLRQYRKHGPAEHTLEILVAIRALGLHGVTLLDIGGGVGVIHHELLADTARTATHVDASEAYIREARQEAARRGHTQHVKFIHADFVDIASDLQESDIVTLDRVVCCYPDFRALLQSAARRSLQHLAMSYPRETWYVRLGLKIGNLFLRLRRDAFRGFLHPIQDMERLLNEEGMHCVGLKRLFLWEVALYSRD